MLNKRRRILSLLFLRRFLFFCCLEIAFCFGKTEFVCLFVELQAKTKQRKSNKGTKKTASEEKEEEEADIANACQNHCN